MASRMKNYKKIGRLARELIFEMNEEGYLSDALLEEYESEIAEFEKAQHQERKNACPFSPQ
jgi:hypothetical protein